MPRNMRVDNAPIFRAAQTPYVGLCFVPPAALVVPAILAFEAAALWAWNRPASLAAAACSLGMNSASYLAGFLLVQRLLLGLMLTVAGPDEHGFDCLAIYPD